MSKNINEQIVHLINIQNNTILDKDGNTKPFEPKNAYLLAQGDGTHERWVTDDNGVISKQAGSGGSSNEIDPIFSASPSATITNSDITNWNKQSDWNQTDNTSIDFIKNKPDVFQEVSATQKGIVNNSALQELGGVDKKIHDVRVGTGNGTSTEWSTVLGKDALLTNTSGGNNNAIGRDSLKLNTIGSYNTAVGDYTLPNNISGNYNTITGSQAGYNNTTGYNNSGYGAFSLGSTTTGSRNTAIGYGTGYKITTGTLNFIAGNNAGNNIITGSQNICIGQQSGKTITNGSENICIGGASGTSSTGATTANGSIADGRSNVFIGTNIGLHGGLSGVNNSHYLIIHNYRNDGVPIVDSNNPLIKGHFVDRWLTIGGKLSVTPTYMPNATGDSTYTKNIVAKADGTFGWTDGLVSDKVRFNLSNSITPTPNTLVPKTDGSGLVWYDNNSVPKDLGSSGGSGEKLDKFSKIENITVSQDTNYVYIKGDVLHVIKNGSMGSTTPGSAKITLNGYLEITNGILIEKTDTINNPGHNSGVGGFNFMPYDETTYYKGLYIGFYIRIDKSVNPSPFWTNGYGVVCIMLTYGDYEGSSKAIGAIRL